METLYVRFGDNPCSLMLKNVSHSLFNAIGLIYVYLQYVQNAFPVYLPSRLPMSGRRKKKSGGGQKAVSLSQWRSQEFADWGGMRRGGWGLGGDATGEGCCG